MSVAVEVAVDEFSGELFVFVVLLVFLMGSGDDGVVAVLSFPVEVSVGVEAEELLLKSFEFVVEVVVVEVMDRSHQAQSCTDEIIETRPFLTSTTIGSDGQYFLPITLRENFCDFQFIFVLAWTRYDCGEPSGYP